MQHRLDTSLGTNRQEDLLKRIPFYDGLNVPAVIADNLFQIGFLKKRLLHREVARQGSRFNTACVSTRVSR